MADNPRSWRYILSFLRSAYRYFLLNIARSFISSRLALKSAIVMKRGGCKWGGPDGTARHASRRVASIRCGDRDATSATLRTSAEFAFQQSTMLSAVCRTSCYCYAVSQQCSRITAATTVPRQSFPQTTYIFLDTIVGCNCISEVYRYCKPKCCCCVIYLAFQTSAHSAQWSQWLYRKINYRIIITADFLIS